MDQPAFENLYAKCEASIKRFVYFKMPSKANGDDVLQEALLWAYRSRESLKNTDSFKPWLLRIVSNKCKDFYRNRGKRTEVPLDSSSEPALVQSRFGLTVSEAVQETLTQLGERDGQILRLFSWTTCPRQKYQGDWISPSAR